VADLADYLKLTVGHAREQFRALAGRRPVQGGRQVTFMPVETLLCLAASFVVNHRHYGTRLRTSTGTDRMSSSPESWKT
jgi:putative restriction endonuclease